MTDQPTLATLPPNTVPVTSNIGGYANATLHLAINHTEHQRRQAASIGVITGHGFGGLDHLMALPHELPVPLTALDKYQRAYARKAPAGILTITDGSVTRHAVRPCRVAMASVRYATTYKLALDSASRFAPFCARRVIVQRLPKRQADRFNDLMQFEFYGIGVTLEHPDGTLETIVESERWRPMRHTPAAWWFAERAYACYLDTLKED